MSLRNLYEQYHDRVQFLLIYIREAHPKDGWWLGGGMAGTYLKATKYKAATDVYEPKTIKERQAIARRCEVALQYSSGPT